MLPRKKKKTHALKYTTDTDISPNNFLTKLNPVHQTSNITQKIENPHRQIQRKQKKFMVKRYHQGTKALNEKIYGMEELPPATHTQLGFKPITVKKISSISLGKFFMAKYKPSIFSYTLSKCQNNEIKKKQPVETAGEHGSGEE